MHYTAYENVYTWTFMYVAVFTNLCMCGVIYMHICIASSFRKFSLFISSHVVFFEKFVFIDFCQLSL